jgi:hypothetical protein
MRGRFDDSSGPRFSRLTAILCFGVLSLAGPVLAQFAGNVGGVSIDAQGMLRDTRTLSEDQRLELLKQEAAGAPVSDGIASGSALRAVSLKRVEEAVQNRHQTGEAIPSDLEYLAGLTAIRYIVFDPAQKDVFLLGPAEGWKQLATGEVVGEKTLRPVLHLEDLIAALRYAFSQNNPDGFIGCSIDPTPEGVARYATYMNRLGQMDRSRLKPIFAGMEQAMGPQAVRLYGVDSSSRFALAMLAADYRLKRIALGHDASPVPGVVNYLDLSAKRFRPGPQKQHRWWFQARYEAILETPDHLAFELVGQGVEVVTAPAIPGQQDAKANEVSSPEAEEFARTFTKHFSAIAEKQPIFAELQNLIALATLAELIAEKQSQTQREEHWRPAHFLDANACPLRDYPVPKQVPSIANYRLIRNRHWLISVSGGVKISPEDLIRPEIRDAKPHANLLKLREPTQESNKESWWENKEEMR